MRKKILASLALFMLTFSMLQAQTTEEKPRTIGLSASILPNQFGIMLPIWISKDFVLAPAVRLNTVTDGGTSFTIGVLPRYYFRNEKVAPYIGVVAGVGVRVPPQSQSPQLTRDSEVDLFSGLAFGADYFFDPKFSIGVEAQGNVEKPSAGTHGSSASKSIIRFSTGTMVTASVYF